MHPLPALTPDASGTSPALARSPLLSLRGITKRFPLVLANDSIDLDVHAGEIHALLGENGAGKSTLMKILYGFYAADAGTIRLNGEVVQIHSPADARRHGIGMLFQDFSLIPALSVVENIALFLQDVRAIVDLGQVERRIQDLAARYQLTVRTDVKVAELSLGEMQKVEILKLLLSGARILVLDEPTRVLAPHEVTALFRVLRKLTADKYAVVLIAHKINEVLDCADRITILKGGTLAGSFLRKDADEKILIRSMFGKELAELSRPGRGGSAAANDAVLELKNVSTRAEGAATSLKEIDLHVHPGEIVGVAGISGNGQKELGDLTLGMIRCASGEKRLFGRPASHLSIRGARRHGVAFIPENPLVMASIPFMTVLENAALTRLWRYARYGGWSMDWAAVKQDTEEGAGKMGYSLPLFALARSLSGGNLQRMVIIRELSLKPRLILASYLTRGLDVQSTLAARQALLDARSSGAGVLLISEDLDELFTLSDRLIVLRDGRIAGEFLPDETTAEEVGYLMTGSGRSAAAEAADVATR